MMRVFVAMVLPFGDGSGKPKILGAYDSNVQAEARCYRASKEAGYELPTDIVECVLNRDHGDIPQKITIIGDVNSVCKFCHSDESTTWFKCCPEHTSEQGPDVVCEICYVELHPDQTQVKNGI